MGGSSGHLASASTLGSLHSYLRICTWVLAKNGTVLGSLLATLGLIYLLRKKNPLAKLSLSLLASGFLFSIVFLSSFYIHDYYGIQIAMITALLAAVGIGWINKEMPWAGVISLVAYRHNRDCNGALGLSKTGSLFGSPAPINQSSQSDRSPLLLITSQYPSPLILARPRLLEH